MEEGVQVGDVVCLKIVTVNDAGAFLACGGPKDLLSVISRSGARLRLSIAEVPQRQE